MNEDLQKIYDAQIVIFKMLDEMKAKQRGITKSAPMTAYERDLEKEIESLRKHREHKG